MKSGSLITGIVVVALLGLGGWYLLGNRGTPQTTGPTGSTPSSTPSPSTTPTTSSSCLPAAQLPTSLTIEYKSNQFFAGGATEAADTFCVRKGATVTFTGTNLWVASAPHPTHTDLPGFDAKGAMASYSFKFDKVGEWGFHNHLRPSDTGTIIVVE